MMRRPPRTTRVRASAASDVEKRQGQTAGSEEEGWRYVIGDKEARRPPELLTRDHVARKIVKDYFIVCESYLEAIKTAPPSRIEGLDMGRRGLHNEGSDILRDRLQGKVDIDKRTARRLFTLICVLHIRA